MFLDVRGKFDLHQSNGATVRLNLQHPLPSQSENHHVGSVTGSANGGGPGLVSTSLKGSVTSNQLFLVIALQSGSIGEYHGAAIPEGSPGQYRLSGTTLDRANPQSQATWFINRTFRDLNI